MNLALNKILFLIMFLPILLIGQDLNFKVLNTFGLNLNDLEILSSPQSIGDLNKDGISEVVLSQTGVDSLFIVYFNKKAEVTRVKSVDIKVVNNDYKGVIFEDYKFKKFRVIGDLDNDGIFEIAVGNPGINKGVVCILFLDNNGELKDYNIIDPYMGEFPFYTDLSPADGFGSAVFPIGDAKDQNSPNLLIQGYTSILCDSVIGYTDTIYNYFDTIIDYWSECFEENDSIVPVIFMVKLNSDGTVKEYNTLELYENFFRINENDTTYFRHELIPLEACNIGDIDGNGINDFIIKGIYDLYAVLFNEDYTIKSSNLSLLPEELLMNIVSIPGTNTISSIPDIDMDGVPELLITAGIHDTGRDFNGSLYIVYLDSLGDLNKLDIIDIDSIVNMNHKDLDYGSFGNSIANIGDVNNDGFSDVLVYSLIADKLMLGLDFSVNPSVIEKGLRLSLNGTQLSRSRNGKENESYFFNGVNNHISIEFSDDMYFEPDFPLTVSLWFKVDAFGDSSSVLFASDELINTYSGYWVGYLPNGKITAGYGDGQGNNEENRRSKVSNSVIDTASWHNVVAVFNGLDDIELYIDCQLDSGIYLGSAESINIGLNQNSVLGRSLGHSASSYHHGKIDELRVYFELPKDQIERLCSGDSIFNLKNGGISIISIYPDSCLNNECVWPGDANFDGIVNSKDIIQIGSVFSETSDKKRTMATTDWVEQTCEDWGSNINTINSKHADSDGNGIVNFSDVPAVTKNYSKVSFKTNETVSTDPLGPPLYIIPNKDTVTHSDSIAYSISFGSSENPAENIYGVSMTLQHDAAELFGSSNTANFSGSWLGTKNVDMIATGFPLEDGIDIGMARIDQTNRTGYGYLAKIDIVTPDNLVEINKDLVWELTDLTIVSFEGDSILPNIIYGDPVVIVGTKELQNPLIDKVIFSPNPSNGVLLLNSLFNFDLISVHDLSGRLIKNFFKRDLKGSMDLSDLPKGLYILKIKCGIHMDNRSVVLK